MPVLLRPLGTGKKFAPKGNGAQVKRASLPGLDETDSFMNRFCRSILAPAFGPLRRRFLHMSVPSMANHKIAVVDIRIVSIVYDVISLCSRSYQARVFTTEAKFTKRRRKCNRESRATTHVQSAFFAELGSTYRDETLKSPSTLRTSINYTSSITRADSQWKERKGKKTDLS